MSANTTRVTETRTRQEEAWSWRLLARCRDADESLFFHPDCERGRARSSRQHKAKEVCATCPVISACREHAVRFQEAWGTWGGLSEDERSSMLQSRVSRIRTHRSLVSPKH
ncbi:WhiB family transcriptional regulator [Mycolicibacterium smegmatis]|uniref:WhiB family transcriptional regulator n=1 Tax=Mycolicibacterium smegmatis TaxID=1772 RepID=UPI0009BD79BD|nr:WhiB family transcriptional regulator [Mycolicibacterium smegmatis]MDF1900796.1 WhiB family transcriptional regulator [Mycolicibacterium smegmatis]MDF1907075.1 WhiB family transcriptional regulator [Mycolicibacterium smegmatis]MDF1919270.1 WhiB family transcriptional regulator [Mycolicibacterium smegmatis]MDF1925337.1 WhiB family transcriptional regulator [Mycolicibacterium smegmatis]UAK52876.1 WhiB family transcriptional regulator [Mycolicibacterium smegmatis]